MSLRSPYLALPILFALGAVLRAQCQPTWNHMAQLGFGVNGQVRSMLPWDPDGVGPMPAVVVVGGGFSEAGGIAAANIALYDPVTGSWSSLGSGTDNAVNALAVAANGDLLVGGSFATAGGVTVNGVARWDGSSWQALGAGFDVMPGVSVRALAVGTTGEVFAGGDFTTSGSTPTLYFAIWDGISWRQAGAGLAPRMGCGQVYYGVTNLVVRPNGKVVAGGQFELAANPTVQHLAMWNGTSWLAISGAPAFGCVTCSKLLANGDVLVGGWASGPALHRWDGANWTQLGAVPGRPKAITELPNGTVVITHDTLPSGVDRWTGTSWTQWITFGALEIPHAIVPAPGLSADAFLVGGNITVYTPPTGSARGLLLWDGTTWTGAPGGTSGGVGDVCALANGDVIAGGTFTQIAGVPATNVARWNGTTWSALGAGPSGVYELAALDSGEIFAGTYAGVFRWAGGTWQQISTTSTWGVRARRNGRIVAWNNEITEWDGTGWTTIPGAIDIDAVAEAPNGDLLAVGRYGSFSPHQGVVARWDGTTWTSLDPTGQLPGVPSLIASGPNDSVVVTWSQNTVPPVTYVMEFDGTTWQSIGGSFDGQVFDLVTLPDGDLLACGMFLTTGGPLTSAFAARWDGQAWHDIAGGPGQPVFDATVRPSGELFVSLGSLTSRTFSMVTSPCPARSIPLGSGCPGAGGANRLTAITWPQVGLFYRARGTELPASGFVLDVIGLQTTTVSLSSLTPLAPAGCTDFVTPLANSLLLPVGGTAERQLDLPNTIALVGVMFHHQMFPVETDAQGAVLEVTATNALSLVVGSVL